MPFGSGHRYDFAVDIGNGSIIRVQCKTATGRDGCRLRLNSGNRYGSYKGQADIIAAYSPFTGRVYWLSVEDVGVKTVELRLAPTRNGQVKRIRLAADYEIERVLGRAA